MTRNEKLAEKIKKEMKHNKIMRFVDGSFEGDILWNVGQELNDTQENILNNSIKASSPDSDENAMVIINFENGLPGMEYAEYVGWDFNTYWTNFFAQDCFKNYEIEQINLGCMGVYRA